MELIKASFIERINRFVVKVRVKNDEVLAYLPNPGRLWELLLPENELLLKHSSENLYKFVVIACIKKGKPILLHTHLTNKYVKTLLLEKRLPFLSRYEILEEEPRVGEGRLDFLLVDSHSQRKFYLEIKTCTLFGDKLAMFPDAETKRGTRHLYEMAELASHGIEAGCLFVVMNERVDYFLPAYHIDEAFTKAFIETFEKIKYWAIAIGFNETLSKIISIKELEIPFNFLIKEFGNWGTYLLLLRLPKKEDITIGSLGTITFKEGFYVYVGSAKKNLKQRLKRYKRGPKKKYWHIDFFLERAHLYKIIPIVSRTSWECELASQLINLAENVIPNFGSSDCSCCSHFFYFKKDPLKNSNFINLIHHFRLEKPLEKLY